MATFSNLSINNAGDGYTLVVSGNGAASVTTNAFDVTSQPTFINFDNLPAIAPGSGFIPVADRLSNQLSNLGVTFSTGLGADYVPVVGPSDAVSPPNQIWLATTDNTLVLSLPYYAVINFVDPSNPSVDAVTDFVSIRGDVDGSSNTLTMEAFDVNGDLIGTDTQPDTGGETVSVSTPGIQSVHIIMSTPQGQVGGIGLDNLMFDPPVPMANHLVVTAQTPGSVTAGSGFGLTVTAEDASGNTLTSFNGTVTVALDANPGGSTLGGTLTATAQDGVATFSGLTLNKAGTGYTLLVSASGLADSQTMPFDVNAATATQLIVTTQPPGSVLTGSPFGLTVTAEDPFDNVDTNFGDSVTVALLNNPGSANLGGTLMATARDGVATFSDLTLDQPANGYTLQVTSTGLTSATTDAVDVTLPQLVVTAQPPGSVTVGSDFGLTVSAEDGSGNVDTSFTGTVTVSLSNNPGGATLGGTLMATAHDGVATFSDLTLDQPGIRYTLEVSASGLASVTTNPFNVQTTVNSSVGVAWGPSATATLETASDGLHLLPAGRNTDVPWLEIDQFTITLAQATTLAAGDVTVGSAHRGQLRPGDHLGLGDQLHVYPGPASRAGRPGDADDRQRDHRDFHPRARCAAG